MRRVIGEAACAGCMNAKLPASRVTRTASRAALIHSFTTLLLFPEIGSGPHRVPIAPRGPLAAHQRAGASPLVRRLPAADCRILGRLHLYATDRRLPARW